MRALRLPIAALVVLCQWLGASVSLAQETTIARAMDAVMVLSSNDGRAVFLGSGFLYGTGGIALTNAHVVGTSDSVRAVFHDGEIAIARVIARDETRDIAILSVPTAHGRSSLIRATQSPEIGHPVIAIGAPLGLGFTATRGIIAAAPRQIEAAVPLRLLQHDAALNPGSSGGPLIDEAGHLLGMNSRIADGRTRHILLDPWSTNRPVRPIGNGNVIDPAVERF